jgi:hypothetical protein
VEVVTLLLFVGAIWVVSALGLFAWNLLSAGHEHADRLAILPLEDNWTDAHARGPSHTDTDGKEEEAHTP